MLAFLGLGAMGLPMAHRLLDAHHRLTVWNRTPGRDLDLLGAGAISAASPSEAVRDADTVVLMLADPWAVDAVLLGDDGVLRGLRSGALVIDCSTVGPANARRYRDAVRGAGSRFVEAPVLGSTPAAKSGGLTVLAGGDAADLDAAEPLLRTFGGVVRTGEAGSANALKLVMNLLVGGLTELLAEAIVLARRSGLDDDLVRRTLFASVLKSPFLEYKAPQLFEGRFDPLFTTGLMLKDLDLILAQADASGIALPATRVIRDLYARTAEGEGRGKDFAAVIETVEG